MGSLVPVPLGTLKRICVSCVDTGRSPVKRSLPNEIRGYFETNSVPEEAFGCEPRRFKNKGKQTNSAGDKKCSLLSDNKDSNGRRNLVPVNWVMGNQLVQKRNEPAKQLLLTKDPLILFISVVKQVFFGS